MTTRNKIHLENPMQPAATNSRDRKVYCTVQQSFQLIGKPPASCSNILKANLGNYRNEEHFQFQTEFKGLVEKYTPETLNINAARAVYLPTYNKEDGTLNVIRKNPLTSDISAADDRCDSLGTGLFYTAKGATYHYSAAK